jgi:hypothetical protein
MTGIYRVYKDYTPRLIYKIDGRVYERVHFVRTKIEADRAIAILRKEKMPCRIIVGDDGMQKDAPRGYWIYVAGPYRLFDMPVKFNFGR